MAVTRGEGWQFNLFRFAVWALAICNVTVYACDTMKQILVKELSKSRIPRWASVGLNIVFIVFLASGGWFFTATLMTLGAMCESLMKSEAVTLANQKQEGE